MYNHPFSAASGLPIMIMIDRTLNREKEPKCPHCSWPITKDELVANRFINEILEKTTPDVLEVYLENGKVYTKKGGEPLELESHIPDSSSIPKAQKPPPVKQNIIAARNQVTLPVLIADYNKKKNTNTPPGRRTKLVQNYKRNGSELTNGMGEPALKRIHTDHERIMTTVKKHTDYLEATQRETESKPAIRELLDFWKSVETQFVAKFGTLK